MTDSLIFLTIILAFWEYKTDGHFSKPPAPYTLARLDLTAPRDSLLSGLGYHYTTLPGQSDTFWQTVKKITENAIVSSRA
jgi:hypothetical protein